MRCTGFCTAASYDIAGLFQAMGHRGNVQLHRDALHFQLREDKRIRGDIYYFAYGAVVFWGLTRDEEKEYLNEVKKYERDPVLHTEDEFTYVFGDTMKIEEDEITLPNKSSLSKFAISHGIAQSVKLIIFEESLRKLSTTLNAFRKSWLKKGAFLFRARPFPRRWARSLSSAITSISTPKCSTPPNFFGSIPN